MERIAVLQLPAPQWPVLAIGFYIGLILILAMMAMRVIKTRSNAHRRIWAIATVFFVAHGMWWASYLASPQSLFDGLNAGLSLASQILALTTVSVVLRLHIARSGVANPFAYTLAMAAVFALGSVATLATGWLSLGVDLNTQNTVTGPVIILALPIMFILASTLRSRRSIRQEILTVSALCGVLTACTLYGLALMLSPAKTAWAASEWLIVWALAAACALVFCAVLFVAALWQSQKRFVVDLSSAIEALPIGLALYDDRDRLLMWNNRFQNLGLNNRPHLKVGMTYSQALSSGMKSSLFAPDATGDSSWLEQKLKERGPGDWLVQSHDETRWIRLQNRRIAHRGLVTIASDFTEQKKHEAELAAALEQARSANQAKSRFLANMSHEIRTPLNGIIALTEALSQSELSAKQCEMVGIIRSSSDNLQSLLSDILDMARIEAGQISISVAPFDLGRLVEDIQKLYANAARDKGVQFSCHVTSSAQGWVMGDANRTSQILNNLLANAVKFTAAGHISIFVTRQSQNVVFRVDDTGIGFNPDKLCHLFGRFQQADDEITRRYGGTGLGLAISTELAHKMGGTIEATSQPDQGSSFSLSLPMEPITVPNPTVTNSATTDPLSVDDAPAPALQTASGTVCSQGLQVLLADDNAINRRVIQLILDKDNIQLTEVENGQMALEACATRAFDLVLMDMQMPVMDGLSATRMIRAHETQTERPHTPIIMLTANAMPEHVSASLEAGADAHLSKPFNVNQLLELTYQLTAR